MGFLAFVLITIVFCSLTSFALIENEISSFLIFFIVGTFCALFSTGKGSYGGGFSSFGSSGGGFSGGGGYSGGGGSSRGF